METTLLRVNETKIRIFSFLDKASLIGRKKDFLNEIIKEIKKIDSQKEGFAGFLNEDGFRYHLNSWNYDGEPNLRYPLEDIPMEKCSKLILSAFEKVSEVLDKREIKIYIFPTISKFTIEKMGGVSGRWIWKNIIYLSIFPVKSWEKHLQSSILHETAHTLSDYFSGENSIGEGIIFEGLAEQFQEKHIGIKNPWTSSISEKEAQKLFKEIRPFLNKKDYKLYSELFFGTRKYPLWAGYALGYYLISKYLKEQKKINWKILLRENPEKILEKIEF